MIWFGLSKDLNDNIPLDFIYSIVLTILDPVNQNPNNKTSALGLHY